MTLFKPSTMCFETIHHRRIHCDRYFCVSFFSFFFFHFSTHSSMSHLKSFTNLLKKKLMLILIASFGIDFVGRVSSEFKEKNCAGLCHFIHTFTIYHHTQTVNGFIQNNVRIKMRTV